MKRWTSLFIMNIQLKITVRYLLIPILLTLAIATIKKAENKCLKKCGILEPLCTVGENLKWYSLCGRKYGSSSKNFKIKLPYDQPIPLIYINVRELKAVYWSGICTLCHSSVTHSSLNVEAISVSMDGWMDKQNMVHIYNIIVFGLKKEGKSAVYYNIMNFENIIVYEIS